MSIAIDPSTDAEWARVEAAMAEQALFLAGPLAGEMLEEIRYPFTA